MTEYKHANIEKEMAVYGYDEVVKSYCRMCHGGCGALIYLKDGKVAKISGDPDCPINHGTLCSKGLASAQLAYHPDRLTQPVRRIGPKGSGKWEKIGWDESNINVLISNDYDNCDPAMGATHIRTLLCRIYLENRPKGEIGGVR